MSEEESIIITTPIETDFMDVSRRVIRELLYAALPEFLRRHPDAAYSKQELIFEIFGVEEALEDISLDLRDYVDTRVINGIVFYAMKKLPMMIADDRKK